MASASNSLGPAYRAAVAWRAILALLANYGLCALAAVAIARLLPLAGVSRIEAATTATLTAILVMPVVPVFVFAARSIWRPTAIMAACAAVLATAAWAPGALS